MGTRMDVVVLKASPDGAILAREATYIRRDEATRLLAAADLVSQLQAQQHADAQAQVQALEAAREQGWQEGMAQAEAAWRVRLAEVAVARTRALEDLAPEIVGMVLDAVASVMGQADPAPWWDAATRAVDELVRRARWARLRVHPASLAHARQALAQAGVERLVALVPDVSLEPIACEFESDVGLASASLAEQLAALREAIGPAIHEALATPVQDSVDAAGHTDAVAPVRAEVESVFDVDGDAAFASRYDAPFLPRPDHDAYWARGGPFAGGLGFFGDVLHEDDLDGQDATDAAPEVSPTAANNLPRTPDDALAA